MITVTQTVQPGGNVSSVEVRNGKHTVTGNEGLAEVQIAPVRLGSTVFVCPGEEVIENSSYRVAGYFGLFISRWALAPVLVDHRKNRG